MCIRDRPKITWTWISYPIYCMYLTAPHRPTVHVAIYINGKYYTTIENFLQNNGTQVGNSESIFHAEFNIVFRFSLAGQVFEYTLIFNVFQMTKCQTSSPFVQLKYKNSSSSNKEYSGIWRTSQNQKTALNLARKIPSSLTFVSLLFFWRSRQVLMLKPLTGISIHSLSSFLPHYCLPFSLCFCLTLTSMFVSVFLHISLFLSYSLSFSHFGFLSSFLPLMQK